MEKFSLLLADLNATNKVSYVFLDANINLLNLHQPVVSNYMNTILEHGFLQTVTKATRMQNDSKSLIDHILSNSRNLHFNTGTLISDVSDHFFTFILPNSILFNKQPHRTVISRDFSGPKLIEFKETLGRMDWNSVLSKMNVDDSYEEFWNIYNTTFDRTFRVKRTRFNKNIHKIKNFMTRGLLISRNNMKILHRTSLAFPTAENVQKYKNFKTLYQRILRAAKKLYFTSKLEDNAKNPKKTWETLNEILGKQKNMDTVDKINIAGIPESDPSKIANQFNQFFTTIGKQISENVMPVRKNPEDYINYGREIPELNLQNTTPEHIQKIIKQLHPKLSQDSQGVSTKMIKLVGNEISVPLAHIFNLSLRSGVFPDKLKICRVIPRY
jgi:hypothetical protein